jgi:hypothetical protein
MDRETHDRLKDQLYARIDSDPLFRARVKAQPKQALLEMGFDVPRDVRVQTIEETEKDWVVFLPWQVNELSERQLEAAVGGTMGAPVPMAATDKDYHKPCFCTW